MRKSVFIRMALAFMAAALVVSALGSCKRIPLYYPKSGVYLKIDFVKPSPVTDELVEGNRALMDKIYGQEPETYRVCFYDNQTHEFIRDFYLPRGGGQIAIDDGYYDILVYGIGTEATRIEDSKQRNGIYAFTSEAFDHRYPATGTVVYEPDHLFVGRIAGAYVPKLSVDEDYTVVPVEVRTLQETFTIEMLNVEGIYNAAGVEMYITAQAGQKRLWDQTYTLDPRVLMTGGYADVNRSVLYTSFNTFGKFPTEEGKVYLVLSTADGSGKTHNWTFDITSQLNDGERIIIIEDEIVIPVGEGQGGFSHKVELWDNTDIDIPM